MESFFKTLKSSARICSLAQRRDWTSLIGSRASTITGACIRLSVTERRPMLNRASSLSEVVYVESRQGQYGDSAYRGKNQRERLKQIARRARDFTNKPAHRHRALSERDRQTNRRKSAVRAKVEHPFLILKRIWGFMKVRYRGLVKNANRAYAMLALINISKWDRPLAGEVPAA